MNRIFLGLATLVLAALAGTMLVGLSLGDVSDPQDRETQRMATTHRLSGTASALLVVLVNSFVITYFVGTSRWCREVSEAYSLDFDLVRKSARLKRRTFPYAVLAMLTVVGIIALGGAADPAAGIRTQPYGGFTWPQLHLAGALAGIAFICLSFVVQWSNIQANRLLIAEILEQVRRIRLERGLDT